MEKFNLMDLLTLSYFWFVQNFIATAMCVAVC